MSRHTRRRVLLGTSGLMALAAGCLEDSAPADEPGGGGNEGGDDNDDSDDEDGSDEDENEEGTDGDEADDEDGDDESDDEDGEPDDEGGESDDDDDEDGDDGIELVDHEVLAYQRSDVPEDPDVGFYRDPERARTWVEEQDLRDDRRETVEEFVSDTDFDESVLVSLVAGAPDLCHEMVVEDVDLEEEPLGVTGVVSDESDDDEMCAEQLTGVVALVRATFGGERPSEVSATITAHDGREHGFGMGVDEASEGTSEDSEGTGEASE